MNLNWPMDNDIVSEFVKRLQQSKQNSKVIIQVLNRKLESNYIYHADIFLTPEGFGISHVRVSDNIVEVLKWAIKILEQIEDVHKGGILGLQSLKDYFVECKRFNGFEILTKGGKNG